MKQSFSWVRYAGAAAVLSSCLVAAVSCKSSGASLSVDLRTDYVPGRELAKIVTEVTPDGASARVTEKSIAAGEAFLEGARIADFGDVPQGGLTLKVKAYGNEPEPLVERVARVTISGDYALTVVVTRTCEGVTCPEPGGDQAASTCDRGKCVKPECTISAQQFCADPECSRDADCVSTSSCVNARCLAGTCFYVPDDGKCDPKQTCDVALGCTPPLGDPSCTATSTTEVACDDGVDDDCDGKKDCEDSDCGGKTCNDGDACTEGETCEGGKCGGGTAKSCDDSNSCTDDRCDPKTGCINDKKTSGSCDDGDACTDGDTCVDGVCTAGAAKVCDDMNPCTTDTCDKVAGCQVTNNTEPCNDGVFCNGADTCLNGTCQVHAGNPCAKVCDEANDKCASCSVDSDCGPVAYGAWSGCTGPTECAETGSRKRTVTTPRCMAGACQNVVTEETGSCPIATDGKTCGAGTTYTSWSGCTYPGGRCDQTGEKERTRTERKCLNGTCNATNFNEKSTVGCTRTVANGTSCGTNMYCCSGSCVSKGANNHCSSCGVDCGTGSSCVSIGGGNYTCTCSTNAQCQSWGFGSGATCYNSGAGMRCNCQCTGNCCAGGATCYKPSGQNYCSY